MRVRRHRPPRLSCPCPWASSLPRSPTELAYYQSPQVECGLSGGLAFPPPPTTNTTSCTSSSTGTRKPAGSTDTGGFLAISGTRGFGFGGFLAFCVSYGFGFGLYPNPFAFLLGSARPCLRRMIGTTAGASRRRPDQTGTAKMSADWIYGPLRSRLGSELASSLIFKTSHSLESSRLKSTAADGSYRRRPKATIVER